jgi:hypothetical protein
VIAWFFPVRLFLYAYALLGPLHYLTQINWTAKKGYFVDEKSWIWIVLGITLLITVPKYLIQPFFLPFLSSSEVTTTQWLLKWSNSFIFLAICLSFIFLYFKNRVSQLIAMLLAVFIAIIINATPIYIIFIGLLIPTILHVYGFTLLFMIKGVIQNNSKAGFLSIISMVLVPLFIILIDIEPRNYIFPDHLKSVFLESQFHVTNTNFAKFLGITDGATFFFYEKMEMKILIFMAFAYTYHYLNWFSKTTVVGWHKSLTKQRSIVIITIWIGMIALFFYNYKLGFFASLFLSILHVLLEFPLNITSIQFSSNYLMKFINKVLSN